VPRVTLDTESGIRLSPELYRRCGLQAGAELLLEETETGLVLHPLRAGVHKVYLFRAEVRRFNFPSCVDCDLRDTCDIAAANDGC